MKGRTAKQDQTLTFKSSVSGVLGPLPNPGVAGTQFTCDVSSSASGCCQTNQISSLTTSICTVASQGGNDPQVIQFVAAGTCTLQAKNNGNSHYNSATKNQDISVISAATAPPLVPQTITISSTAPNTATILTTYTVTATSDSGLAVSLAVSTPSTCTISGTASGSVVSHIATGTCTITANQAGNSAFLPAAQVTQSYTINKAAQTIQFTSSPGTATAPGTYSLSAATTSGLAATFSTASASTICTVSGSVVTLVGSGSCTVRADQTGDSNWAAATQVTQTFQIGASSQTITPTSTPPGSPVVNGPTYTMSGTATSTLVVTFNSATPTICSIAGAVVSFLKAGTCTVQMNQAGNATYAAAPTVSQTMTVGKGSQTVTVPTSPTTPGVGGSYTVAATASTGLPVTFSTTTSTCTVSGALVSFVGGGSCTVVATQAGNSNFLAATNQVSFTIGVGQQTISFSTTAPNPAIIGFSYLVGAVATSSLPVTLGVTGASAGICAVTPGTSLVVFLSVGTCVVKANQPGDGVNYAAAPQKTQSIAVFSLAAGSSPPFLAACTTLVACSNNVTGLMEPFTTIDNNLTQQQSSCFSVNCTDSIDLPWLTPCTQTFVPCILNINAQRVANYANALATLAGYAAACSTPQCTSAVATTTDQYTAVMRSIAFVCATSQCLASTSAAASAQQVWAGAPNAVVLEEQRFDADVQAQTLGQLYLDTQGYYSCPDAACRDTFFGRVNESYAVQGYVQTSLNNGMAVANASIATPLLTSIDAAYLPCALGPCDGVAFQTTKGIKRAYYAHELLWSRRLAVLLANCTGACDRASLTSLNSQSQRDVYTSSNYLPVSIDIAGIVIYSAILLACIAVFALAVFWQSLYGKMLFALVLLCIALAAIFRISFFAAAIGSGQVQVQYVTFVALDKIGLIFFCLAILCFAAMWSQAISILMGENAALSVVIPIVAIIFAAAIVGIIIYFAVVVSVTYVNNFYYTYVTDYADIILSFITFFLAAVLLVQIGIVGSRIRKSGDEEKMRNLLIIAIGLAVMVLFLAERVVLVMVYNFVQTTSLGYGIYYGVATILPEVVVSAVMLAILLFTFSQPSRDLSSGGGGGSSATTRSGGDDGAELGVKRTRYDSYK